MTVSLRLISCVLLVVLGLAGCSGLQTTADPVAGPEGTVAGEKPVVVDVAGDAHGGGVVAPPAQPIQKASDETPAEDPVSITEANLIQRQNLIDYQAISIRVPHVDVILTSGAPRRETRLEIRAAEGMSPHCKLKVIEKDRTLEIQSSPMDLVTPNPSNPIVPISANTHASGCRFAVNIALRESALLNVDIVKGSVLIENWSLPAKVRMKSGDIDVGSVGPLDVECGRCTLAGETLAGPLRFAIETGNVGLAGLSGSVEGKTHGDMILKWSALKAGTNVKVQSRAGDIYLMVPKGSALAPRLEAPRGDVDSRFTAVERGVPLVATAELGNVRLLPLGK